MGPDVTAVIVDYGTPHETALAAESVLAEGHHGLDVSVVVVNNRGPDEAALRAALADLDGCVILATNPSAPCGFACGANFGLETVLSGERPTRSVLFLNSDARLDRGALAAMQQVMSRKGTSIVGAVAHTDHGSFVPEASRVAEMLGLPWPKRVKWSGGDVVVVNRVDGACVMVDVAGLESRMPLWDERFHMYMEDVDLSWRLAHDGVAIALNASYWHEIAASASSPSHGYYYQSRNRFLLISEHCSPGLAWILRPIYFMLRSVSAGRHLALGRPLVANAVMRGCIDGWVGRTGPRVGTTSGVGVPDDGDTP